MVCLNTIFITPRSHTPRKPVVYASTICHLEDVDGTVWFRLEEVTGMELVASSAARWSGIVFELGRCVVRHTHDLNLTVNGVYRVQVFAVITLWIL